MQVLCCIVVDSLWRKSCCSVPHLPHVQIHPLPSHPPPPRLVLAPLIPSWPLSQVLWTRPLDDLRHAMPCEAAGARHVDRAAAPEPQGDNLLLALGVGRCIGRRRSDDEDGIATQGDGYQPVSAGLGDVAVHAQRVAGGVEIHYCRLCSCTRPDAFQQRLDVCWEWWRRGIWILFRGPVVLAAESGPAHFLVQELRYGDRFVDAWVEGSGDGGSADRRVGEERRLGVGVGEVIVGVDVGEVCWIGEVAVK